MVVAGVLMGAAENPLMVVADDFLMVVADDFLMVAVVDDPMESVLLYSLWSLTRLPHRQRSSSSHSL